MKKTHNTLQLLFILLLFFCPLSINGAELLKVNRVNNKDIVQLYFTFDKAPKGTVRQDNRRIDLIFSNTEIGTDLHFFEADADIVKILPHKDNNDEIVTFYFRYKVQDHKLTPLDETTIVFEVLLGNEYSSSYQKLADRLKGLTVLDRTSVDLTNPYHTSPYKSDWFSFFSLYESPVEIDIPVHFSLPPFPLIGLLPPNKEKNLDLIGKDIMAMADRHEWELISAELLEKLKSPKTVEEQKLLALTYGESMVRKEDFKGAYTQLYLLRDRYPDELIGAYSQYLLTFLEAVHQNPYQAHYDIANLDGEIGSNKPLTPYIHLFKTDLALAAKDYPQLNKLLLEETIAYPLAVEEIMQVREADYWTALGQTVKAYAAYRLVGDSKALWTHAYSLNGFCNTEYQQKKFTEAAKCYESLAPLVTDKETLGLVNYRRSMSRLKFEKPSELVGDFGQIENAFPETEAGWRGATKRADLLLLGDHSRLAAMMKVYNDVADNCFQRDIREESLFKAILCQALLGEQTEAISKAQKFLRDFQTGAVRISAQALLIELIPKEIKKLVDEKKYIDALVLAKQNKELFQNNWIDAKYLVDIAAAYQRIGIYDEAQRLYLYLIETMPVDLREKFYLPMIQATFDHGNYPLVEDYAVQYSYNYPDGKDSYKILLLRIMALLAEERPEAARAFLPQPLPDSEDILHLAASIYFRSDDFVKARDALERLVKKEATLTSEEIFMYAESLFRTNEYAGAQEYFSKITADHPFYDQSLYRLAVLARKRGEEKMALSLFRKLVEEGKKEQWKSYAERELQIAKSQEATDALM